MTQARAQGRLSPPGGDPCTQRGGRRHCAAAGTSRPEADLRDLLPLPLHGLPDFEPRLAAWRLSWLRWGVEGFNAMWGRGRAPARARGSALQLHALASLAARVETVPDCPPDVTKRGALFHVLATDAGYGDLHLRSGTHASFQRGEVALPRVPSGAVILAEMVPPLARDLPGMRALQPAALRVEAARVLGPGSDGHGSG